MEIMVKSNLAVIIRMVSRIRVILTSYEIVCATPRNAPRSAYFEFEHHPAMKVEYTPILLTDRK
jgi:predicted RecB family nuclease